MLGGRNLIYVPINCVAFNLLFYAVGVAIIKKEAAKKGIAGNEFSHPSGFKTLLSKIINVSRL